MAYIGLISDTHRVFDSKVREFLKPVDTIWHAGDFGSIDTYSDIVTFKSLVGVYGNCDGYDIRAYCHRSEFFEVEGMKVLMMHIGGYPGRYDFQALRLIEAFRPDIFVCGHSHILKVVNDKHYNMLVLNPGACGREGFHNVRTALRFHIEEGKVSDMEVGQWPKFETDTLN